MALRTALTRHVHDTYMEKITYYKAGNLDHRIDGADQYGQRSVQSRPVQSPYTTNLDSLPLILIDFVMLLRRCTLI